MKPSLWEEERAGAASLFVGRASELRDWARILGESGETRLLLIHAPAGSGKSSLLSAYAREAAAQGHEVVQLDARDLAGRPFGMNDLWSLLGDSHKNPRVVLIDNQDALADTDDRFRNELLRRMGPLDRVVLAGRAPPATGWKTLALWGKQVRSLALGPLSTEESVDYLTRRGVGGRRRRRLANSACGHPLALALLCESAQNGDVGSELLDSPEVLDSLCRAFLSGITEPRLRDAFELAAIARTTTQELIEQVLRDPDARGVFDWLRASTIVQISPNGLVPHDVAREVIAAELRWRNPTRHRELMSRALGYFTGKLAQCPPAAMPATMVEFGFLIRQVTGLSGFFDMPPGVDVRPTEATPSDLPSMVAMVEKYESKAAADVLRHWFERQPGAFTVMRDDEGVPAAFITILNLAGTSAEDRAADPGSIAVYQHARALLRDRPLGALLFVRFLLTEHDYQSPSPMVAACASITGAPLVMDPNLTLFYHYFADIKQWEHAITFAGARAVPEADFEVGGIRYATSVQDRRDQPHGSWLEGIVERAMLREAQPSGQPEYDVARAVRAALRSLHDLEALAQNPLSSAPAVASLAGEGKHRGQALRRMILAEIDALQGTSRDDRLHRAVKLAYVTPAPSQERAAEMLGISYATFRRHLEAATTRIAASVQSRLTI